MGLWIISSDKNVIGAGFRLPPLEYLSSAWICTRFFQKRSSAIWPTENKRTIVCRLSFYCKCHCSLCAPSLGVFVPHFVLEEGPKVFHQKGLSIGIADISHFTPNIGRSGTGGSWPKSPSIPTDADTAERLNRLAEAEVLSLGAVLYPPLTSRRQWAAAAPPVASTAPAAALPPAPAARW